MANGQSAAVTEAARLDEIGFPEFTAKLITDVFDALVAANIRQMDAYVELLQQVGKSLTTYINDTQDDIDGAQILQFLAAALPPDDPDGDDATKVAVGKTLEGDDATALNTALALPDEADPDGDNEVAAAGELDQAEVSAIMEAAAKRIAANKYDLLQQMVQQGILRLVVENGVIETRLTFTTYGSSFYQNNASDYNRSAFAFRAKAKTGSLISRWVDASASTSYTNVRVRTTNQTDRDTAGSRVNIYGGVKVEFKTDYLPLNQ